MSHALLKFRNKQILIEFTFQPAPLPLAGGTYKVINFLLHISKTFLSLGCLLKPAKMFLFLIFIFCSLLHHACCTFDLLFTGHINNTYIKTQLPANYTSYIRPLPGAIGRMLRFL